MTPITPSTRRENDDLVVRAQLGERAALGLLVAHWHRRLLAHAVRLTGDHDLSAEAVQNAWLEILKHLKSLRDEAAFPAWAFRIVTRQCSRQVRGRIKGRRLAAAIAAEPARTEAPATGESCDADKLRLAVAGLPPHHRAAVALFYFEGLGVAEIAVALEIPAGTVKTRLMHARRALLAALHGGEHGSL